MCSQGFSWWSGQLGLVILFSVLVMTLTVQNVYYATPLLIIVFFTHSILPSSTYDSTSVMHYSFYIAAISAAYYLWAASFGGEWSRPLIVRWHTWFFCYTTKPTSENVLVWMSVNFKNAWELSTNSKYNTPMLFAYLKGDIYYSCIKKQKVLYGHSFYMLHYRDKTSKNFLVYSIKLVRMYWWMWQITIYQFHT